MKRAALLLLAAACTVPQKPEGREDTSCTWCHGSGTDPAPPRDLHGNTGVEFPGVGSHQRHLVASALFPKVECATCHPVPATLEHDDGVLQLNVAFESGARTCTVACHGPVSGVWTRPRADSCGSCHGTPPPAPHPQAGACEGCHGVLSATTHVDGRVTLREPADCNACHRPDETHARHLGGGSFSKAVACETCHDVPATVATAAHPNGKVEVKAQCSSCHLQGAPQWSVPGALQCSSCHAAPPQYPHPQLASCSVCHPAGRSLHVDGVVQAAVPSACDACHGSAASPAPPRDLDGGTETSRPGVGAHEQHLVGRGTSRPVPCGECHAVPAEVRSPGHLDGTTQVRFSGAAIANGAMPAYSGGTCTNTACHDVSNWTGGAPGGGTATAPVWTSVDGGQATCTSCHGQPPPAPHPARSDCAACHPAGALTHVNGHVDFGP